MTNKITKANLIAEARSLGATESRNGDAFVRFLTSVVMVATVGEVTLEKRRFVLDNENYASGITWDDATEIANAHVKAVQTAATFDAKKGSHKALASKIRAMVKYAQWMDEYCPERDPAEQLSYVARWRIAAKEDHEVCDMSRCLLAFARAQTKAESLLTKEQVVELCLLPDSNETLTARAWWNRVYKQANQLSSGRLPKCPEQDESNEMLTLLGACIKRLGIKARK